MKASKEALNHVIILEGVHMVIDFSEKEWLKTPQIHEYGTESKG